MPKAKVFLDTNIYKFSATELRRFRAREVRLGWGRRQHVVIVHDAITVNPNDRINNPDLKLEADLLPQVAALSDAGLVIFLISTETLIEGSGIPDMDSARGFFYGAARQIADPPVRYSRILFGGHRDWWQEQLEFLRSLKERRFLELQKITGAYQGKSSNRNQLLDAYHLWCAEHNHCDFFLSLDFKLARIIEKAKNKPLVPVVRPSQLLNAIRPGKVI